MSALDQIRNSKALRWPLLAATRLLLRPLKTGPALLRRAAYDAMPIPYLVTGRSEQFVVSTADKVIGRELFLHSEFDFDKLQTAIEILILQGQSPPSHLIDVGANIGTITIPALKRGLMQTATAIEPHPGNLRLLRANLALNGIEDCVTVRAQAVGDRTDTNLFLHESTINSGNHAIGSDGILVHSSRLDDLPLPPTPALLWMDIEGYEGHALTGASGLLSTGMPVVCEFNTTYLKQAGGMTLFQKALQGRLIFDLKDKRKAATSLEELTLKYPGGDYFTDIIAIAQNANI
ncbi:FkbM family methyltransferase [Rhodanobacter thiooxydans]|uniref:FkbM family methyltransferase n=1 Tax=Rhodanobacter thiooxydans TaxID=416169 RepID=UPI0009EE22FF|nr:FkbM family methyltransferase [Rhodanobacter thiooxydans]